MKLVAHVHGLTFVVPCGTGEQSVKWLGLVASQRYSLVSPHGRQRMREDAHVKQGLFLPTNILTKVRLYRNRASSPHLPHPHALSAPLPPERPLGRHH
jgi:hypothetical protein